MSSDSIIKPQCNKIHHSAGKALGRLGRAVDVWNLRRIRSSQSKWNPPYPKMIQSLVASWNPFMINFKFIHIHHTRIFPKIHLLILYYNSCDKARLLEDHTSFASSKLIKLNHTYICIKINAKKERKYTFLEYRHIILYF